LRVFIVIAIVIILLVPNIGNSQEKGEWIVQAAGIASTDAKPMPHYMHSNNWGVIDPFQQSWFNLYAGGKYQLIDKTGFSLNTGVSAVLRNEVSESILHQLYVRGRVLNVFDFSIGKEAYTPVSYNDTLTVGGFLMNSNARPIPKVILGIYDYLAVPFTKGWVEVKGGLTHGWLNDDRTAENRGNSADSPYLHEKWAYVRLGNTKIQPFVGIVHNAIYGGTRPNGTKIPIDYLATFFAQGSERIGGGEATNAAGAHEGFWDIGMHAESSWADMVLYVQKPFADGSGLKIWQPKNRDYKIGGIFEFKNTRFVQALSVELIKTEYQSGPGIPDAIYPEGHPKQGQIIWLDEIDDYDAFMFDTFGEVTNGWGKEDVSNYLVQEENYGHEYGGRDDYNNNGTYYNGWTYHKQSFGMPLYHSKHQTSLIDPSWVSNESVIFKNTRVRAVHIGMRGEIAKGLKYLLRLTHSRNYGSYSEEYTSRYSWTKEEDFLYESGKNQTYTQLQLRYRSKNWDRLQLSTSLSVDAGELYNSLGLLAGVSYRADFRKSK
jgi:hypothetical protein